MSNGQNNSKFLIAIIIGLAVLLIGAGVYIFKQQGDITEQEQIIDAKNEELEATYAKLDQLSKDLQQKMNEIQSLNGNVDSLKAKIEQLEKEKRELKSSSSVNYKRFKEIQGKVSQYEALAKEKDAEIARLKEENQQLKDQNASLSSAKDSLNSKVSNLEEVTQKLNKKLSEASVLKAQQIVITAVNDNGKERDGGEYKSKHLDKLKVKITLAENRAADKGNKKVVVRVLDPSGATLFNEAKGSGTFTYDGKEVFYTSGQEIMYDNKQQDVVLFYTKGSEYKSGKYTVEVFAGSDFIGEGYFTVK